MWEWESLLVDEVLQLSNQERAGRGVGRVARATEEARADGAGLVIRSLGQYENTPPSAAAYGEMGWSWWAAWAGLSCCRRAASLAREAGELAVWNDGDVS